MKYRFILAAALVALFFCPDSALADVINLKDGGKIEGEIIAKTEKQVVIKVDGEFKTVERSDILSIEEKEEKKAEPDKEKIKKEPEKKPEKKKDEEAEKDLTAVKRLYNKWQRSREALLCTRCKGDGKLTCKLCKGKGHRTSLSVGGGQGKVRCRDCMGRGTFDCKKCKATGRNLEKIKILFWEILDPAYKEREGVATNKQAAIDKGVATATGKQGFSVKLDTSRLTKKFNLVKDLKHEVKGEYAAVTWKCIIGEVSWTEGIVLHKVDKKWYWLPDMAPNEIPDASK